ncbi:oxysterol-binding protein-related protein 10-like isoform X2 [Engraulis encrasicolus]|uniref:oxysterol-binding protein-related protein 10-like isoform X2 n=1 Tax=Engraulis encrasicolus TaxID=184585 RepID=UPI002FD3B6D2
MILLFNALELARVASHGHFITYGLASRLQTSHTIPFVRPVVSMEKTLYGSPGTAKGNSGSLPTTDRGNSARKTGRTGSHSPGSASLGCPGGGGGNRGDMLGNSTNVQQAHKRQLEGVLSKYTNLIQGWQNRYFVLDSEHGHLQYFVNEHGKSQKPRGSLPLTGASVTPSDEAPHMFIVNSANGELFKLRATDAIEQQFWVTQLQACARRHSDSSAKVREVKVCDEQRLCVDKTAGCPDGPGSSGGRTRSFSLLPHMPPTSSSPGSQRHLPHPGGTGGNIVTITHHKSPAAARRAKHQYPSRLQEVKEVMSQAEGQQKSLVQSIESLPTRGPISCLDQDLLLLKATSAATLSCLGECLNILQHSSGHHANNHHHGHNNHHGNHLNHLGPSSSSLTPNNTTATTRPGPGLGSRSGPGQGLGSTHDPPTDSLDAIPFWTVPRCVSSERLGSGDETSLGTPEPALALKKKALPQNSEATGMECISPTEEVTDTEDNEEEDLGVLEDQRSIILHLLSQLKLGMDLTRVVLPTFILEKRSLLEMYANFMAHPDLFLAITAATTPEERMVRFVEYYLTAFHEGRRGAVAKKPYNPALGETFHCSWAVPRDRVRPLRTHAHSLGPPSLGPPTSSTSSRESSSSSGLIPPPLSPHRRRSATGCHHDDDRVSVSSSSSSMAMNDAYRVRFVAEQVSHHPPVSGFYCECVERKMCVNAHVWTKSKFMGMSVGVSMVGEGVLCLLEHDEEYVFTLPCAYARSILTVPWVELGGKVSITCAKTGYSASVTFHTKPFYGGKVHRVTAEVKHGTTGTIVCKAQGEWNGTLEFTYSSGETKVIDTNKLPVIRKRLRPIERQGRTESRRLWQHVTTALKEGNIDMATDEKHRLEERQRGEERQRTANNMPWKPKYFTKEGDGWVYVNPLWKTH